MRTLRIVRDIAFGYLVTTRQEQQHGVGRAARGKSAGYIRFNGADRLQVLVVQPIS